MNTAQTRQSILQQLSTLTTAPLIELGTNADGSYQIAIDKALTHAELAKVIEQLQQSKLVKMVTQDIPLTITNYNPNAKQWNMSFLTPSYSSPLAQWSGDNFASAWQLIENNGAKPGHGVIVAVLDSGYTPHPNLLPSLIGCANSRQCFGYQFISDCRFSGDEPCDYNHPQIEPRPDGLDLANVSHGTHVAGIISAQGYDPITQTGVLGGAYAAKILPVRVLGYNDKIPYSVGWLSDIINGIYYAIGKHPTITNNTPAQIINLSIGCSPYTYKDECSEKNFIPLKQAIDMAYANNVITVVAANNSQGPVELDNPMANFSHVISVSAKGPFNNLAFYSDYGSTTITAAGGDDKDANNTNNSNQAKILSTVWAGTLANGHADYAYEQGTSMAAPAVSAAIADIISYMNYLKIKPNFELITQIIQNSSSPLANPCNPYTQDPNLCVSGMALNVGNAISYLSKHGNNLLIPSRAKIKIKPGAVTSVRFINNGATALHVNALTLTETLALELNDQ